MPDPRLSFDGFRMKWHIPDAEGPFDVLIAVHGISRRAGELLRCFRKEAGDRFIILAPRFDKRHFGNYQRLGLYGRGQRADLMLDAALDRFSEITGHRTDRFHLFGFSGGAQFAHRYAMRSPGSIRSLHLGSSGWYTFPDPDRAWPYGLGGRRLTRQMIRNLPHFRALPITTYVGALDTARDPALRQGEEIDRQQGRNRVERAHTWADAVGDVDTVVIPDAAHSFLDCCNPPDGKGLAAMVMERCCEAEDRRGSAPFEAVGRRLTVSAPEECNVGPGDMPKLAGLHVRAFGEATPAQAI